MARVFIVEDDAALRDECERLLGLDGYETAHCTDFARATSQALASGADCVILDLRLPGTDGHSVCRDIRAASSVPIIVLTSSDSEFDEVMAMNLGADDYICKPYSPAVLLARVRGAIRRANPAATQAIEHRGVVLDAARSQVCCAGRTVDLSRNELRILAALMRSRGAIVSRQDLMYELWQSDEFVDDNTLTVNVNRLRRCLENIGVPGGFVETKRGQGYLVRP